MPMVGSENGKGRELPGREVGTVWTGLCPEIWSLCRHVWPSLRTGARRAYLVLAYARWVGPPGPGGRVPGNVARPGASLCCRVWSSLRTGARRAYLVLA